MPTIIRLPGRAALEARCGRLAAERDAARAALADAEARADRLAAESAAHARRAAVLEEDRVQIQGLHCCGELEAANARLLRRLADAEDEARMLRAAQPPGVEAPAPWPDEAAREARQLRRLVAALAEQLAAAEGRPGQVRMGRPAADGSDREVVAAARSLIARLTGGCEPETGGAR